MPPIPSRGIHDFRLDAYGGRWSASASLLLSMAVGRPIQPQKALGNAAHPDAPNRHSNKERLVIDKLINSANIINLNLSIKF